jgi:hypothetical protein
MRNGVWTHSSEKAKAYPREDEHFVEPIWVSQRLFEEEKFAGEIYDPACGFGRIVESALAVGIEAYGSDLVDRGFTGIRRDFLRQIAPGRHDNIVTNPPFDQLEQFTRHAVERSRRKTAVISPTARLNAARWLKDLPLRRIWLLTPRPSMPPGHVVKSGGKVTGGKQDYCWLIFERGYVGQPELDWLHRDGDKTCS